MRRHEISKEVGNDFRTFIEVVINDKNIDKPVNSEMGKTFDVDNRRFVVTLSVKETEKYDPKDV